jgi:hypothetical protein
MVTGPVAGQSHVVLPRGGRVVELRGSRNAAHRALEPARGSRSWAWRPASAIAASVGRVEDTVLRPPLDFALFLIRPPGIVGAVFILVLLYRLLRPDLGRERRDPFG